jgi:signal transduction histidine kinase
MARILVVEDSLIHAAHLIGLLEARGFETATAAAAEQALALFGDEAFDMVISDVVMPGMSGYDFCRTLKTGSDVPVILLTGLSGPMELIHAIQSGADGFLTKPYSGDDLVRRVDRILESRRGRAGGSESAPVAVTLLGEKFVITSQKEQILDLLISAFEDLVRTNQELQRRRSELASAKAEVEGYAAGLEERVRERTADLEQANEDLQTALTTGREAQEQLVQAQKMEAIGNLTGGMAHDFNNLLGIIIGNLDLLRKTRVDGAQAEELISEAIDAVTRGAELTRGLLAFARRQPLRLERVDVNALISRTAKLLKRTLGEDIRITLDLDPMLWPVVADPTQLEASITNLATNARDAMPKGGHLSIRTKRQLDAADDAAQHADVVPGDCVIIEVADTGTGMPRKILDRIFEPFFTTKEPGKGTGLGLSMVFGYVKQAHGHLSVHSEVGAGTMFRICLRRAGEEAEAVAASPPRTASGGKETVLVVEDNAAMRRIVVRHLRRLNYRILDAGNAAEAIATIEREAIDLLFTDMILPDGLTGIDVARVALAKLPATRVIVTSGFPRADFFEQAGGLANVRLLPKPYRSEDLGRAVREALDQ